MIISKDMGLSLHYHLMFINASHILPFQVAYFSTSFARKLCISSNAIPVFAAIVSSSSISSSALATSNLPFFIPCSIPSSLHPSIFCFFFQFFYCPCNICNHMFYLLLIRIQNFYCLLCNAFLYCISYPVFKFLPLTLLIPLLYAFELTF